MQLLSSEYCDLAPSGMFYFAAACMTWELAESGVHFITTVINGADLVPTFSAAAVDDLRSEVSYLPFHVSNAITVNSIRINLFALVRSL